MLSQEFKTKIKEYKEPLFYNSSGNKQAYQLFVRHLSFAPNLGLAKKEGKYIVPIDSLYLVDFEKEQIVEVKDKIELVPIKYIS